MYYFDENGDPPAIYELINWQQPHSGFVLFKVVGAYDSIVNSGELSVEIHKIVWKGEGNEVSEIYFSHLTVFHISVICAVRK